MTSDYIIAKLHISEDISLMAMIDNNTIHYFDEIGNNVKRDLLNLPEVFVLNLIEGENRCFVLINDGESITHGNLYVINNEDRIIFSSTDEEDYDTYTRITSNSVILGIKDIESESHILIPTNSYGRLINNNQLTNKKLIGIRNDYYLFSEESESPNEYHLYALRPKFYDTDEPRFAFVRKFHADFLILWNSNVIYYNHCNNDINVKAYGAGGYYWDSPKEQSFNIEADLKNVNWTKDVQLHYDEDSIILHHTNTSADYHGFTIVIEQIEYGKFKLCNQKRLGRFVNGQIQYYANSLIKFDEGLSGISVYDRHGKKIAKTEGGYDYVKERPHITDYAVFTGELSIPEMRCPYNTSTRSGVISTDKLEMVVPPDFNKVDFIVLEEPAKKYHRQKGNYEIYIKVCLETVNQQQELTEIWGLFKHSECVVPCFYKSIDVIRLKSNFIFILEQQNGLKGIFYKDRIVTQCIYEGITESSCYLIMNRSDGLIDILYVDNESIRIYECHSSVTPSTVQLKFLKNAYSNSEAIIVRKNNKYGLICRGQLVADYIYDEIKLINAEPNVHNLIPGSLSENPLWFILEKDEKKGLYGTEDKVITDIIYDDADVIDWRTYHNKRDDYYEVIPHREFVMALDGKYYTAKEKKLICDNVELTFRGFISPNELVFSDDDETRLEFYTHRGEKRGIVVFDQDGDMIDIDVQSMYSGYYYAVPVPTVWRDANIQVDFQDKEFVFSFWENKIISNPLRKDRDDNDEYDEWRNNGGNLDDKMEGMGF